MFGSWKIYLGLGIAFAVVAGLAYWYFNWSQNRMAQLAADKARLETAVQIQHETIQNMTDFYAGQAESMVNLQKDLAKAEEERQKLNEVLGKHDLTALARSKPGLIENRMNEASRKALRNLGTVR